MTASSRPAFLPAPLNVLRRNGARDGDAFCGQSRAHGQAWRGCHAHRSGQIRACTKTVARPSGESTSTRTKTGDSCTMRLRPFSGLLPSSNDAATSLLAAPYDCVSNAEARLHIAARPNSFLPVIRPDAVVAPGTPPCDPQIYSCAADALQRLCDAGELAAPPAPAFYVYEQSDENGSGAVQRGIVALVSVDDYEAGLIKKHENTRPDKVDDRTRLIDTLSAHTGPVFLTYRDVQPVDAIVNRVVCTTPPEFDVTADDGVRHRVWLVPEEDGAALAAAFEEHVSESYIADGHHRAASAAKVARSRAAGNESRGSSGDDGDDDSAWFLAALFPETQLNILSYNRVVKDLAGMTPDDFLFGLRSAGKVVKLEEQPTAPPVHSGDVLVFVGECWYRLEMGPASFGAPPPSRLDCGRLQDSILAPLLGVSDPRTDSRLEFVDGAQGINALEEMVMKHRDGAAFLMCPVTVSQLMEVADAGALMPPKSTWFAPKLGNGFFVQTF